MLLSYWYIFPCQNALWVRCIVTYRTIGHLANASNSQFMKLNTSFLTITSPNLNILLSSQGETTIYPISKVEIWESSLTPPSPKCHIPHKQNLKTMQYLICTIIHPFQKTIISNICHYNILLVCFQIRLSPIYLLQCSKRKNEIETWSWSSFA